MTITLFKKIASFFTILIALFGLSLQVDAENVIVRLNSEPSVEEVMTLPDTPLDALGLIELRNGNLLVSSSHKFFEYSGSSEDKFERVYITKEGYPLGQLEDDSLVFLVDGKLGIYNVSGKKERDISLKIKGDYYVKKAKLIGKNIIAWIDAPDFSKNLLCIDLDGNVYWARPLPVINFNVSKGNIYCILYNDYFDITSEKQYKPNDNGKNVLFVLDIEGKSVKVSHLNSNIKDILGFGDNKYLVFNTNQNVAKILDSEFKPIAKFDQMNNINSISYFSKDKIYIIGTGPNPNDRVRYVITNE